MVHIATTAFFLFAAASIAMAGPPISIPKDPIRVPGATSPIQKEEEEEKAVAPLDIQIERRALVIDLGPLPEEEKQQDTQGMSPRPQRIGIHRPLPREFIGDLAPLLEWTPVNGHQRAAVTFAAEGAVSLRIAIRATLPAGTVVQVFDGDGHAVGPPLTPNDFTDNGPTWAPSVEGDTLTVQITTTIKKAVSLTVTTVAHRYATVQSIPECDGHVDLACIGNSSAVHEIADAVAYIEFDTEDGSYACTGTLLDVEDTPDVFEPYFLTANHCVGSPSVAKTVEAFWFYRHARCGTGDRDWRFTITYGGTALLATSAAQDSSLLQFQRDLPGNLYYAKWSVEEVQTGTYVQAVHHSAGYFAQYAEGRIVAVGGTVELLDTNITVSNAFGVDWDRGITEGGASGSGVFKGSHLVGVLSAGPEEVCSDPRAVVGPFSDFYPHARQWLSPSTYVESFTHTLATVPTTAYDSIQGFVRVINFSDTAGVVEIYATDDGGNQYGPIVLRIGAYEARHFNSHDLERGNPAKGINGGVGNGIGMWRLELVTELEISALAYIRTPDGFVTSMHRTVRTVTGNDLGYYVGFFNPGSNTAIRSLLRVINPGLEEVDVKVWGIDDEGSWSARSERFSLGARRAVMISAQELEESFGGGVGKWRLYVTGSGPLQVMSLLSTPTGHLTNLSW